MRNYLYNDSDFKVALKEAFTYGRDLYFYPDCIIVQKSSIYDCHLRYTMIVHVDCFNTRKEFEEVAKEYYAIMKKYHDAYSLYKEVWLTDRGVSDIENFDEEVGITKGRYAGQSYACYGEFIDNEFNSFNEVFSWRLNTI